MSTQPKRRTRAEAKRARNRRRYAIAIPILILAILAVGAGILKIGGTVKEEVAKPKPEPVEISILCSGDIVVHKAIQDACKTSEGYDFSQIFRYIKPEVEAADWAFCCMECALTEPPYTGFPMFHIPDVLATNVAANGYDTVILCSNHANDAGESGLFRTMDVIEAAGLDVAGVRRTAEDPRYLMRDVNGVKVAMVAYTYGGGRPENRDLNGNPLSDAANVAVNSYSPNTFDEVEFNDFKAAVDAARAEGANLVIGYFHWGDEYHSHSNSSQQHIAERVAKETDVDIIIGSHPHNPQEYTVFDRTPEDVKAAQAAWDAAKESDEKPDKDLQDPAEMARPYSGFDQVPCYYSMGNLMSNQRRELLSGYDGTVETEEGYMVRLNVTYDKTSGKLTVLDHTPIPYWMDMYGSGTTKYTLVPLTEGYQEHEQLTKSGNVGKANEAKRSLDSILAGNGE